MIHANIRIRVAAVSKKSKTKNHLHVKSAHDQSMQQHELQRHVMIGKEVMPEFTAPEAYLLEQT